MHSRRNRRSPRKSADRAGAAASFSGQYLLYDKDLAKRLVCLLGDVEPSVVIDIGAGTGALTIPLAGRGHCVLAVESDPVLAEKLRRRVAGMGNVKVIQQDFLRMSLPRDPFQVVSNIPFSITTPILGKLMDRPLSRFQGGAIVVEYGAAIRFTRTPITAPRILGWHTWFDLDLVQRIPAASFSPPPRVDAAALRIRRRDPPPVPPEARALYMGLLSACLRVPRIADLPAASGIFTAEQVKRLARRLRMDRNEPVCHLDVDGWVVVYETMCRYVEPHRWPRPVARA